MAQHFRAGGSNPQDGGVGLSVLPTLPGLERGPLLEGQRGWYRGIYELIPSRTVLLYGPGFYFIYEE